MRCDAMQYSSYLFALYSVEGVVFVFQTSSVTEGCGQTQSNVRMRKWHIYFGDTAPEDVGYHNGQKGERRQGKDASVLKGVEGCKTGGAGMGQQHYQQCVVAGHAGISKVRTKRPRERIDVIQSSAPAGEQDASAHPEKGEEHPEQIEEEKAKRVDAGYRERRDLGTGWLIEHSGIMAFACNQGPEQ